MMQASPNQPEMDMNDPATLGFYRELILFQHDFSKAELLFPNPSNAAQRTIQALAHSLDLVFEYTMLSQTARVVRHCPKINSPRLRPEPTHELPQLDYDLSGVGLSATIDEMLNNMSEFSCSSTLWGSTTNPTGLTHYSSDLLSQAFMNIPEQNISADTDPSSYFLGGSEMFNSQPMRPGPCDNPTDVDVSMSGYDFENPMMNHIPSSADCAASIPISEGYMHKEMSLILGHEATNAEHFYHAAPAKPWAVPETNIAPDIYSGYDAGSRLLQQTKLRPGSLGSSHSHRSQNGVRKNANSYLRPTVRLFIASMGSHDAMLKSDTPFAWSTTDDGESVDSLINEYKQARLAVGQENWANDKIHSIADYLRMLFDDNGEVMDLVGSEANEFSAVDGFDFGSFVK
ncbi:hypothetical protein IFR04_011295 [Cadophora malorum]|uniref:Uncharacterized protein n=1 Tax=Cadophora malorum TaxID=108018 RepID=A0A8H7T699_9HELO|nr:hypothetical protein IFR04_011295 [Cadophora malorum]